MPTHMATAPTTIPETMDMEFDENVAVPSNN
jgi:hypothetical protein